MTTRPFASLPPLSKTTGRDLDEALRPLVGGYFITTEDVANPWRDKRTSARRPDSVGDAEVVKAGVVIYVTTARTREDRSSPWGEAPALAYNGYDRYTRIQASTVSWVTDYHDKADRAWREVLVAMLRVAEPHDPTVTEIADFEYGKGAHAAHRVLEALAALGLKVTPDSVRLAIRACEAQDDEEEAAHQIELKAKQAESEARRAARDAARA